MRGGYMNLLDQYTGSDSRRNRCCPERGEGTRYSRGFGGIAGAGAEFTVSNDFAVTTELLAMRNHMTTYRLTSTRSLPVGKNYGLTSYRLVFGIKYNPLNSAGDAESEIVGTVIVLVAERGVATTVATPRCRFAD